MKMKKIPILLFALMAISLGIQAKKIPVHAWLGGPGKATDKEIADYFADLKSKGIDALMYNGCLLYTSRCV